MPKISLPKLKLKQVACKVSSNHSQISSGQSQWLTTSSNPPFQSCQSILMLVVNSSTLDLGGCIEQQQLQDTNATAYGEWMKTTVLNDEMNNLFPFLPTQQPLPFTTIVFWLIQSFICPLSLKGWTKISPPKQNERSTNNVKSNKIHTFNSRVVVVWWWYDVILRATNCVDLRECLHPSLSHLRTCVTYDT